MFLVVLAALNKVAVIFEGPFYRDDEESPIIWVTCDIWHIFDVYTLAQHQNIMFTSQQLYTKPSPFIEYVFLLFSLKLKLVFCFGELTWIPFYNRVIRLYRLALTLSRFESTRRRRVYYLKVARIKLTIVDHITKINSHYFTLLNVLKRALFLCISVNYGIRIFNYSIKSNA